MELVTRMRTYTTEKYSFKSWEAFYWCMNRKYMSRSKSNSFWNSLFVRYEKIPKLPWRLSLSLSLILDNIGQSICRYSLRDSHPLINSYQPFISALENHCHQRLSYFCIHKQGLAKIVPITVVDVTLKSVRATCTHTLVVFNSKEIVFSYHTNNMLLTWTF